MAFCPNCGAQVEGRFCAKCGAAVAPAPSAAPVGQGAAPAPGPAPGAYSAPQPGAASYGAPPPGAAQYGAQPYGTPPPGAQPYAQPAASTGGLTENVAGALCYVPCILAGIIFLVLAPYNQSKFVRFHAFQSIIFGVAWIAIWIAFDIVIMVLHSVISLVFLPIAPLISLAGLVIWVLLVFKAYQGQRFKLPVIGDIAEKQA